MGNPAPLIGKTVVVNGGRGFIGLRLVRVLAEREKANVVVIARSITQNPWGDLDNVRVLKHSDAAAVIGALTGARAVVNLAYDFSAPSSELLEDFDLLMKSCEAAGAETFVQFSSIAVYDGWPGGDLTESSPSDGSGNTYKITKRAMERRLASSALRHTILQPTVVYGAGSTIWTEKIFEQFRQGEVVLPSGEEGLCHAVHVDDVVDATIAAICDQSPAGACYIISGPEPVGWRAFYKGHADLLGKPAPRLEDLPTTPPRLPVAAAPASGAKRGLIRFIRSVVPPQMIASAKRSLNALRHGGRPITYRPSGSELVLLRARGSCSITRAGEELGYRPKIDFDTGLRLIAASMKRR